MLKIVAFAAIALMIIFLITKKYKLMIIGLCAVIVSMFFGLF